MPKHTIITLVVFLALIVAGVVIWVYPQFTMNRFNRQYSDATKLSSSGNSEDAIAEFSRLLKEAPDKASEGKLKVLLAGNLFSRNSGGDRAEAVNLYKSVVNDYKIPAYVRALALNNIANIVSDQNESFYKLYFPESPYQGFMPSTGSENFKVYRAYAQILTLSDQVYPTSYAEYSIAGNYYAPALAEIPNNNKTERLMGMSQEEAALEVQKYVREGDARNDDELHVPHVNVRKYLYRALALNVSGRILGNLTLNDREDAFQLVLTKGAKYETDNVRVRMILMDARFFYANFLLNYPDGERDSNIREILKPFGAVATLEDSTSVSIHSTFASRMSSTASHPVKTNSGKLAEISPEYKVFVDSLSRP